MSCNSTLSIDIELTSILKLSQAPLQPHSYSYCDKNFLELLGKVDEQVFSGRELNELSIIYGQLNPGCTVKYLSPFYARFARLLIGSDIIGSKLHGRSGQSSSVIAAFWPTIGQNIEDFDHARASIGKVQYFIQHTVTILDHTNVSKIQRYTLAYVSWMNYHHDNSMFGISATVCATSTKELCACSFIPALRISAKCATCTIKICTVFVACPIPLKFSI